MFYFFFIQLWKSLFIDDFGAVWKENSDLLERLAVESLKLITYELESENSWGRKYQNKNKWSDLTTDEAIVLWHVIYNKRACCFFKKWFGAAVIILYLLALIFSFLNQLRPSKYKKTVNKKKVTVV